MTITRISSFNSFGNGGAYSGYGQAQRRQETNSSIWGNNNSSNNYNIQQAIDLLGNSGLGLSTLDQIESLAGISSGLGNNDPIAGPMPMQGLNYAQPGASYAPLDQIMTAPFGANENLLGSSNPFAAANSNNIFSTTNVNANNFNSLSLTNTNIKSGFDNAIKAHMTNINTPSGNFNFSDVDAGNFHSSNANLIGNINSYRQTNTHITSPDENLYQNSQVIHTPTETITRTRTRGTIW